MNQKFENLIVLILILVMVGCTNNITIVAAELSDNSTTHTYRAEYLKPLIHQSYTFYCAKWKSAQIVNAFAMDGGESGTISNSPTIYND